MTGSILHSAKIWDAETGKFLFEMDETKGGFHYTQYGPEEIKFPFMPTDNSESERVLDVSSDKFLTIGSDYNTVSIRDLNTAKVSVVLQGHTSGTGSLQFSPDGTKIISSGYSDYEKPATNWVWDVVSGKLLLPVKNDTVQYNVQLYSPDSKKLVTTGVVHSGEKSRADDVKIWDATSGKLISKLKGAESTWPLAR